MPVEQRVRDIVVAMQQAFPPVDFAKSGTQVRAEVKAAAEKVIAVTPEPVAGVVDRTVPGPRGEIPVRIYRPVGSAEDDLLPLVAFMHGGGWTVCDLDSHDAICRAVCNAAGCVIVAIDYRLAPEHPFPVPIEDCFAATQWCADNAARVGADAGRIAVMGDSAGGNLAAAVALMARDRGGPALAAQVLVYPVIDHAVDTASHAESGEGFTLLTDEVQYYWRQYLNDPSDGANPYASPIRAESLANVPRALIITAEFDPLRDEGEAYGQRLRDAGVPVTVHRYDGVFHSFFSFFGALREAEELRDEIGAELRNIFGLPASSSG